MYTTNTTPVTISLGTVELKGDFSFPQQAHAIVIFAHGSGSSRLSPRNQMVAALRTLTPVFECIKADSVVHGLQRFVKGNNIDLLVMFPYRYSAFEKMFVKKVTSPLIFHLNVPLLLIPEVGMNSDIQKAKRQNSNISW